MWKRRWYLKQKRKMDVELKTRPARSADISESAAQQSMFRITTKDGASSQQKFKSVANHRESSTIRHILICTETHELNAFFTTGTISTSYTCHSSGPFLLVFHFVNSNFWRVGTIRRNYVGMTSLFMSMEWDHVFEQWPQQAYCSSRR
jgi:hypothetical protein